jgi:hypothetical protein
MNNFIQYSYFHQLNESFKNINVLGNSARKELTNKGNEKL